MIIGVPEETEPDEYRVAVTPAGVEHLRRAGHSILIQQGAGVGPGLRDGDYEAYRAHIVDPTAEVFEECRLNCKVSGPLAQEAPLIDERHVVTNKPVAEAFDMPYEPCWPG